MASGDKYVHFSVPSGYVHYYPTKPNEQGKTYDRAFVHIPDGTKVNGVNLGGYETNLFMSKYNMQDLLGGKSTITFSVPADKPITVFKGDGDERVSYDINAWDLAKGLKAEREQWKAEHPLDGGEQAQEAPEMVELTDADELGDTDEQAPEVETDEQEMDRELVI